jgi:hypothetical protein
MVMTPFHDEYRIPDFRWIDFDEMVLNLLLDVTLPIKSRNRLNPVIGEIPRSKVTRYRSEI